MPDPGPLLTRQAAWQSARRRLPWPEKIKMAELARDAILRLRAGSGREGRGDSGAHGQVPNPERRSKKGSA
jgi:hypothetical protein